MKPQEITQEELDMVRVSLILPIILDTLEHDIGVMRDSKLKMGVVHIANLKQLQGYVLEDIKVVKRKMRDRGIKILVEGKTETGYRAEYLCRGYRHELAFLKSFIRTMVVVKLAEYMEIPLGDCK